MPFEHSSARSYQEVRDVGIAIRSDLQLEHVAILFRDPALGVLFCHLRNHHDFRKELPLEGYYWDDCGWLKDEQENAVFILARLHSMDGTQKIPFGLQTPENPFSLELEYEDKTVGRGLTCSSFIYAIFKTLGYAILKFEEWPVRDEDAGRQIKLANSVRELGDAEQANLIERHIPTVRIRPEEAAVCSVAKKIPVSFKKAKSLAKKLLKRMKTADEAREAEQVKPT